MAKPSGSIPAAEEPAVDAEDEGQPIPGNLRNASRLLADRRYSGIGLDHLPNAHIRGQTRNVQNPTLSESPIEIRVLPSYQVTKCRKTCDSCDNTWLGQKESVSPSHNIGAEHGIFATTLAMANLRAEM